MYLIDETDEYVTILRNGFRPYRSNIRKRVDPQQREPGDRIDNPGEKLKLTVGFVSDAQNGNRVNDRGTHGKTKGSVTGKL